MTRRALKTRLYKKWEDNGYFHAEVDRSKKPFTIVMPPPNITGQLHMGHALDNTMQDILIRYKRMQGYNALWQPGTDHAAIATEVKVINKLKEEGINKADLGREGFLEECWKWREEYGTPYHQPASKNMGSSADWDRENVLPWMKAVLMLFRKYLLNYMKKDISTRVPVS